MFQLSVVTPELIKLQITHRDVYEIHLTNQFPPHSHIFAHVSRLTLR